MQTWIRTVVVVLALFAAARVEPAQVITFSPTPTSAGATGRQLPACIDPKDVVNVDWRSAPNAVPEWGVPVASVMEMYLVPAGKHLVLLEFRIMDQFGYPFDIAPCLRLVEIDGPTTRVKVNNYNVYYAPLPSGLVFSPSSTVAAVFDLLCLSDPQMRVRYQLTGYLQDVAAPGCVKATDIVNVDWRSVPSAGPNGLTIKPGVATEVWAVPAGKRFVLQQYLGVAGAHLCQSLGGQLTYKRDLVGWGGGLSELVPFGVVFEPGSSVVLTGGLGGVQSETIKFSFVGYLVDV